MDGNSIYRTTVSGCFCVLFAFWWDLIDLGGRLPVIIKSKNCFTCTDTQTTCNACIFIYYGFHRAVVSFLFVRGIFMSRTLFKGKYVQLSGKYSIVLFDDVDLQKIKINAVNKIITCKTGLVDPFEFRNIVIQPDWL